MAGMKVHVTPSDFQTLQEKSMNLVVVGDDGSIPQILKASAARFGDTYSEKDHRNGATVNLVVVWAEGSLAGGEQVRAQRASPSPSLKEVG